MALNRRWRPALWLSALVIAAACGEITLVDRPGPCVDRDDDGHLAGSGCAEATDCDDFEYWIPGVEVCDAVDNDCDGLVDEGFPDIGEPCRVGACTGRWFCADEGEVACGAFDSRGQLRQEICDGVDDDCDGLVDENVAFNGYGCRSDKAGRCANGMLRCLDARPVCVPDIEPATFEEVCNGRDDDCDGVIDELTPDPTCYPGPEGTPGVGPCRRGIRRCELGRHRTCVGAITPDGERCDGVDEDCDGAVDEGLDCGCEADAERACPPRAPALDGRGPCVGATQRCVDGRWGRCEGRIDPRPETCDGRDEDCDGGIDEDAAGVGAHCEVGRGECLAAGETVCIGGRLRCDAAPGEPQAEQCSGSLDYDCDGAAAPREVGRACGERADGVWICGERGVQCLLPAAAE